MSARAIVVFTKEPDPTAPAEFDFSAWRAEQNRKRARRRLELETALRAGKVVRQHGSFWTVDATISTLFGPPSVFRTFIDTAQADPAYLADHLESREYGFGFETVILSTGAGCE